METSQSPIILNNKRALIFCENDYNRNKIAGQLINLGISPKFSTSSLGTAALLKRAEYTQEPFDLLLIDSNEGCQAAINTSTALCLHLKNAPKVLLLSNITKNDRVANLNKRGVKGILKNNFSNKKIQKMLGETMTLSA